jgi:hypothetical protein
MSASSVRYLIDTSVLIQAHRAYYSFRIAPGFWDSLVSFHNQGTILSIDKVFDEICDGDEDELSHWVKNALPKTCFSKSDNSDVIGWYALIQQWANAQNQFSAAAKAEFADDADAWVIAYAGAKNLTVVTQEVFNASIKRKIPIPNVCKANNFKVPCIDVYAMLARLGVQLVKK